MSNLIELCMIMVSKREEEHWSMVIGLAILVTFVIMVIALTAAKVKVSNAPVRGMRNVKVLSITSRGNYKEILFESDDGTRISVTTLMSTDFVQGEKGDLVYKINMGNNYLVSFDRNK